MLFVHLICLTEAKYIIDFNYIDFGDEQNAVKIRSMKSIRR